MVPSDEIPLVCSRCFSSNRPEAVTCHLCAHRLDRAIPRLETGDPNSPMPVDSPGEVNPYAPPASVFSPAFTFKISSLLLVIAVIAICLGVAHENLVLGILLSVAIVPALVYTVIVIEKRKARGIPMAFIDKVLTFVIAIGGVVIVEFSAVVAFCMTCYPIGYMTINVAGVFVGLVVATAIGGVAGIAAAWFVTYRLVFRKRGNRRISGKP